MRCHGTVRSTSTSASECWMSRNWDPRCWPEGSTTWPEDYRLGGRWPCGSTSTSDPGRSGQVCTNIDIVDSPDLPRLPSGDAPSPPRRLADQRFSLVNGHWRLSSRSPMSATLICGEHEAVLVDVFAVRATRCQGGASRHVDLHIAHEDDRYNLVGQGDRARRRD